MLTGDSMKLLAVLCACVVALGSSPVSHTRNDSTRHPLAKIVGRDGGALDDSFGGSTPEYSNVSWHSSSLSEEAGRGGGSPHDAPSSSSGNWSSGSLIAKIVGSDGGALDDSFGGSRAAWRLSTFGSASVSWRVTQACCVGMWFLECSVSSSEHVSIH